MQQDHLDTPLPQAASAGAQCEVLFEAFAGKFGTIQLGRLLKGNDAGRLVALRKLTGKPSAELASATDLARSIVHPRLAKVLGIIRDGDGWYVASEYIAGVTLFELEQAVRARGISLDTAVAVRIMIDTLKAADEAQRLLADTAHVHGVRCVYPESIWIAEFGEVFVAELLVAPLLADATSDPDGWDNDDFGLPAAAADVRGAVIELIGLLGGDATLADSVAPDLSGLPAELSSILLTAMALGGAKGFETPGQFGDALSGLSRGLIATEQQVSEELQQLMGFALKRRRHKLEMLERLSEQPSEEDATKFFRVAVTADQHDTARPPPSPASDAERQVQEVLGQLPKFRLSDPADQPTALAHEPTPPAADGSSPPPSNPISAVWQQARALIGAPARRQSPRPALDAAQQRPSSNEEPTSPRSAVPGKMTQEAASSGPGLASADTLMLLLVIALTLSAAARWLWVNRSSPALPHVSSPSSR